jgi:hypothetical protein
MRTHVLVAVLSAVAVLEVPVDSRGSRALALVGAIDLRTEIAGHGTVGVGLSTFRDLLFVSHVEGSVRIYDISDPAKPAQVGETSRYRDSGVEENRVVNIGDRVVLVVSLFGTGPSTPKSPRGLKLFDVTEDGAPSEIGFWEFPQDVRFQGSANGARHFDITKMGGRTLALLSAGSHEAITSNFGAQAGVGDLLIVDISDPTRPSLIGEWGVLDEPTLGRGFYIGQQRGARADGFADRVHASNDGTRVHVAYSDQGVMTLDISNPSRPRLVAHIGFKDDDEGNAFDVRTAADGDVLLRTDIIRFPFQVKLSSEALSGVRTGGEALSNTTLMYSLRGHAITSEVVFVGAGCPGNPFPANLRGKLALFTLADCSTQVKAARAQQAGAIAVIFFNDLPTAGFDSQFPANVGGNVVLNGVAVTVVIPGFGVGQNTGRCLAQLRDSSGHLSAADCRPAGPVMLKARAIFQGYGKLHLFDVEKNPPVRLSTFATRNSADVDVALANRPPNPLKFFTATQVEVRKETAFIGWDADGLRIVDISRPKAPKEIAFWNGEGAPLDAPPVRAWQVAITRDLVLLNSLDYGVYILRAPRDLVGMTSDE